MLTKLIEINKVARSNCGLSSNLEIFLSVPLSLSRQAARSSADNEKNATSEPANKADKINKPNRIKALIP